MKRTTKKKIKSLKVKLVKTDKETGSFKSTKLRVNRGKTFKHDPTNVG